MRDKKKTEQVVVKLKGNHRLVEEILNIIEQSTNGVYSKVMQSDDGYWHAFATVFEVFEE